MQNIEGIQVLYFKSGIIKNTNKIIRNWESSQYNIRKLKRGWMPPHPALYLKKEVYDTYGMFNLNYQIAADYDFILRLLSKGGDIRYISKYTVKMRVDGKSNTLKNMKLKMKEDLMALRVNNIGGYYALFMKSLSKVSQFFNN